MSTYKLYYFNRRGRAEISRLILAAADQKYEDVRYERDEWSTHKPQMPLGQIPVLEVDGVKLVQSLSIARFLAKQFHLAGKDNFEQAKVDAVVDTIDDAAMKLKPIGMEQDEAKKQEFIKKYFSEDIPINFQNLEVLHKLYGNGSPYFVGNQLTWADLRFYNFGDILLEVNENCLDNYSWLKQNRTEVEKQPKIAEYLKNRPKTVF